MNIGSTPVEINESNILQNLDLDQEAKKFDGKQLAFVIRQSANQEIDGLNRDWMVVSSGAEKHQGYAFQWFALAVVALLFWLFTGLKRKNLER